MSSVRRDEPATQTHTQPSQDPAGLHQSGQAANSQAPSASNPHAQPAQGAQQAGGGDTLEASGGAGFKSSWAQATKPNSTPATAATNQDTHDQNAQEAVRSVSDYLKNEQQKRV